ncbi:MAG: PAS domain S-box protein [Actinobacteria bacterium]|uniref:histidine kinase n=1 Tax=freshwater metagenome TaxID=449393 RepID=A0A6J6NZF2_9ZZZZ|nr:PAS domain S-box protein [Actinomycetota bacterium]
MADDVSVTSAVERRLAEQAMLLEHANDAIVVRDLGGRITYWSPGAERLYGWPADDACGRLLDRFLRTQRDPAASTEVVTEALLGAGSWEGELTQRSRDGAELTVLSRKTLLRGESGEPYGVLVIASDITARRRAEQALARSEELFRSQFTYTGVGQAIRSPDDVLESVNPALARMLGYDDIADLVGRSACSLATPASITTRRAELLPVYAGEREAVSFEAQMIHRDGTLVDVQYTSSVIRDVDGRPLRFISTFQDISERKRAERARDLAVAELQARHDELAAMSQLKTDLMGILGHQLKNPVANLSMAAEVASATWAADSAPAQGRFLDLVTRNAQRIQQTIDEVLSMVAVDSGQLTAHPDQVRLVDLVDEAVASTGVSARTEADAAVVVLAQRDHLHHILDNLFSNAVKYAHARIEVRASVVDPAGETSAQAAIEVVDDGPGIPEAFQPHLFERFAQRDKSGRPAGGTGLGLFIARQLARANGGDLVLESSVVGRTCFILTLPLAPDPGTASDPTTT